MTEETLMFDDIRRKVVEAQTEFGDIIDRLPENAFLPELDQQSVDKRINLIVNNFHNLSKNLGLLEMRSFQIVEHLKEGGEEESP